MNNADMPAMAQPVTLDAYCFNGDITVASDYDTDYMGLTKREQACLTMGVADTGDAELDAIITKGNKNKFAGVAMQSLLAHYGSSDDQVHEYAIHYANALLKALEPDNE